MTCTRMINGFHWPRLRTQASLIRRSSTAASLMTILWHGVCLQELSPTLMAETKQSRTVTRTTLSSESEIVPPHVSSIGSRAGSRICSIFSGNAPPTYSGSVRPSLNASSVGAFPTKVSRSMIPKLYTSPWVETFPDVPYSETAYKTTVVLVRHVAWLHSNSFS
jgi:hypothetical protein